MVIRRVLSLAVLLAALALPVTARAQQTLLATAPCPTAGMPLYPGQLCVRTDLVPNQVWIFDAAIRQWDQVVTFQGLSGASLTTNAMSAVTGVIGQQYLAVGLTSAPNTGVGQADLVFALKPANASPIPVAVGQVALEIVQSGNTCQAFLVTANGRQFWGQGVKC